jgi:hypothetical protein
MELFGLLFAVPVTLFTSTVFCFLALWAFTRWPFLRPICGMLALLVLLSVAVEVFLSVRVGPLQLHNRWGVVHEVVHYTNFFLAPPAVACAIFLPCIHYGLRRWVQRILAIGACWFTCMAVLLGHITVDEEIYGVDGSGVPPTQSQ